MTEPITLPPVGPASARPPAVERDALRDSVLAHLSRAGSVLLTGPAGIGRTTLVSQVVADVSARGHQVLRCSPSPAERDSPFLALIDLLTGVGDDTLATLAAHERAVLETTCCAAHTPGARRPAGATRSSCGSPSARSSLCSARPVRSYWSSTTHSGSTGPRRRS